MTRTLLRLTLALALLAGAAPAFADGDGDEAKRKKAYDDALKAIAEKNIFAPFKPKPKPRPKPVVKPRQPPKPAPKPVVKPVFEEFVVTGLMWDDVSKSFVALIETRSGDKPSAVGKGDKIGKYTVQIVMEDKLCLVGPKGDAKEVALGEAFEGEQIGSKTEVGGSSSSTSSTSSSAKPDKPLPKLDAGKKMSIIERLKARRKAQLEKKKREAAEKGK